MSLKLTLLLFIYIAVHTTISFGKFCGYYILKNFRMYGKPSSFFL